MKDLEGDLKNTETLLIKHERDKENESADQQTH